MNSLLIRIRNSFPSKNLRNRISKLKNINKSSIEVNSIPRKEINKNKLVFDTKQVKNYESQTLNEEYQEGNYIFIKQLLNKNEIEKIYYYLTEDEDLDPQFEKINDSITDEMDKEMFIDLDEKMLYYHLFREDLNRRGSSYIIHLANEIVHRYRYNLSLELVKKNEKKIYFSPDKKESAYNQKLKQDISRLDEKGNDKLIEVYMNPDTRIKLKQKFFFFDQFWDSIMNVEDSKIKGKVLLGFLNVIIKTLSQRLEVWEKFVRCFALNLREFDDSTIEFKPLQYIEILKILNDIYWAYYVCKGINIPCHLMKDIMIKYRNLFIKIINSSKEFDTFDILPLYKCFTNERSEDLEAAVRKKLELVGEEIEFSDLPNLLTSFSLYYEDAGSSDFSIIENLFIKATKLKKLDNANKIEYARKKLKLDQKVDKADINNTMINFKIFEPEIFVLRNFALNNKWFPYKYMNHFIQSFLELDYYKNIQLVVEMSQLFTKFAYYDPDHNNKLMNALNSLSFSEININLLFDIFVLSITNSKLKKQFLEISYENIIKYLKPHINRDTPAQFKRPFDFEEIECVYDKIINYYNNVLHLKNNNNFRENENKFGEASNMIYQVYMIYSKDDENHLNSINNSV